MNIDALTQEYQSNGVIRIPGVLAAEQVREVKDHIERYRTEYLHKLPAQDYVLEADGESVRNFWRMDVHDTWFAEFPVRLEIEALLRSLLNGDYVVMTVETFNKPPEGSAVPPHQDNAYFCQSPPDVLTVWLAIDAATTANGPVTYRPGTHTNMLPHVKSGVAGNSMGLADPDYAGNAEEYVGLLEPGDALIHHCQIIHYSKPNTSPDSRCGLLVVCRNAATQDDPALAKAYRTK